SVENVSPKVVPIRAELLVDGREKVGYRKTRGAAIPESAAGRHIAGRGAHSLFGIRGTIAGCNFAAQPSSQGLDLVFDPAAFAIHLKENRLGPIMTDCLAFRFQLGDA